MFNHCGVQFLVRRLEGRSSHRFGAESTPSRKKHHFFGACFGLSGAVAWPQLFSQTASMLKDLPRAFAGFTSAELLWFEGRIVPAFGSIKTELFILCSFFNQDD
jgi:hypothetical protein